MTELMRDIKKRRLYVKIPFSYELEFNFLEKMSQSLGFSSIDELFWTSLYDKLRKNYPSDYKRLKELYMKLEQNPRYKGNEV